MFGMSRQKEPRSEQLLTRTQVAEQLAVHEQTVWRLEKSGDLPRVKIGRSVRYRESDVNSIARHGTS